MTYHAVVLKKQRKRTGFLFVDLVYDVIDWIRENPEKAIVLGILTTFAGIGIATAGATLEERRRKTLEAWR